MEGNSIFLKDGMPIGYKFEPTDYEALYYYLLPKISRQHIKPWLVYDVDIYNYQPQNLPGFTVDTPSFYFTPRELKFTKGSRPSRSTRDGKGFWKMTSKITKIKDASGLPLGRKSTLVYHLKSDGTSQKTHKTNYIMQEYVLEKSLGPLGPTLGGGEKVKDVVLCKIYLKKSSKEKDEQEDHDGVDNDQETNRVVKRKRSITQQTEEISEWSSMAEQRQSNLACRSLIMVPNEPAGFNDIGEFYLNQDNRQPIEQLQSIQPQLTDKPLEISDASQMFDEIPHSSQGNYQYVQPQVDFKHFNNTGGQSSHDLYRQIPELQHGQELGCSGGAMDPRFDTFQLENPSTLTPVLDQGCSINPRFDKFQLENPSTWTPVLGQGCSINPGFDKFQLENPSTLGQANLPTTNQSLTTTHAYHLPLNQETLGMEYGHGYRAQSNGDTGATNNLLPPLLESFAPSNPWIQTYGGHPPSLDDNMVEKLDLLEGDNVVKKQGRSNPPHSNKGQHQSHFNKF